MEKSLVIPVHGAWKNGNTKTRCFRGDCRNWKFLGGDFASLFRPPPLFFDIFESSVLERVARHM